VQNGAVLKEFQASKYMLQKHPRTAIGFNTRYFFMVVVDGRRKEISMGMKPDELGSLMLTLGCTEAMNLDGGGSSTFWADGKTRNSVAGSRERDRSDALVVVKKASRKVSLNERY
jgi:exopolysaccharide biosynthesis protein